MIQIKTQMSPDHIGRYEVKSEIGRGGMATVFHANDPRFERDVAIKVLPPAFMHDPQFRVRFEREAKTIALLEHPAIVPVYDFGEQGGQPYIVMRYMSGGSLEERLKEGPLSIAETVHLISRLAPALDAAHTKGIIHRDLKPGNILFDRYGNAFLSDFGIARLTQGSAATLTGDVVLGTPAYMSPEQVQGDRELDGRSDLYSLGIILFQMLTGKVPFSSDTPAKTMLMHILEPVPQLLDIKPGLPPAIAAVLGCALAKEPEARFATIGEMASALEATISAQQGTGGGLPSQATTILVPGERPSPQPGPITPPSLERPLVAEGQRPVGAVPQRPTPRRNLILVAALALGALGLVAAGGLFLFARQASIPAANLPSSTPSLPATQPASSKPVSLLLASATPVSAATAATATATPPNPTTSAPVSSATATLVSTATEAPEATATDTPLPLAPIIGGADQIAFLNADDIWISNLDGSQLAQLTFDHAKKTNLSWSPDGQVVIYILGKCVQSVDVGSTRVENLACFEAADFLEAFEISPDGQRVAISLNRELYIVPFDRQKLSQARFRSDLQAMAGCPALAPYTHNDKNIAVKSARWSRDGQRLAITRLGVDAGRQVDLIHLLDIANCTPPFARLDEFPATRFKMKEYAVSPFIQNFTWDGDFLFALTSYKRNDGFGDLWIYSTDLHRGFQANPIEGACCYRDPQFSPDGSHLLFVFQDMRLTPQNVIRLYYIPYGTIGTGLVYAPLSLPQDFFADPRTKPLPALRPAR
ncbi:MAG TPA: protein kinase [Anaerolineales bacterium]|nr:protein kinase [Anaerolineales bacterium]